VTLNDKATMIILAKTVKKVIVNANKNIVWGWCMWPVLVANDEQGAQTTQWGRGARCRSEQSCHCQWQSPKATAVIAENHTATQWRDFPKQSYSTWGAQGFFFKARSLLMVAYRWYAHFIPHDKKWQALSFLSA
jgi:hypothetical protein